MDSKMQPNIEINRQELDKILKSEPISTTKTIEADEITRYRKLFELSLCIQDPAVRQIFIAFTNKFIKRIKDSHRVVARDLKKYTDDERKQINGRYMDFLTWLIDSCFDGLYCNAYFGSYTIIMITLKLIIQHITFDDPNLVIVSLFKKKSCYDSILCCLNDSFEENKALALELLALLPQDEGFINEENLKCFRDIAYQLVASVNPAHSLTCQYVFKLSINLELQLHLKKRSRNEILIDELNKLSELVEQGIKDTQENFVSALRNNAIYPKLTCIGFLLNQVKVAELELNRQQWTVLAKRIVVNSIEACKAVSTIVCNLNPETIGHLPMDQKPIDAESLAKTLNVSLKISDGDRQMITSQLLLISGWKTIKECSHSLGTLCTRFWWPKGGMPIKGLQFPGIKDSDAILESDDIIQIIDYFEHYLRNLRHRGAFEQAYNGFLMVTKRIWHDPEHRARLTKLLEQIMADFKGEVLDPKTAEYLKAYVTRRSAGLPFMVQAILISESDKETQLLDWIMESLFTVIEDNQYETYKRIHCLNILKAVIKDHHLGDKVKPHVGRTFAITLDCFSSDSFPIRNCASMLLKAVVDRTFGANRSKFDLHRKNQLSFGKFFYDSPKLHQKMIDHLRKGIAGGRDYIATLHGVFIILFRLRPTLHKIELHQPDEELIQPFLAPIIQIAKSTRDYKIRELSAQLVFRLDYMLRDVTNSTSPSIIWQYLIKGEPEELSTSLMLLQNVLDVNYYQESLVSMDEVSDFLLEVLKSEQWKKELYSFDLRCQLLDVVFSCLLVAKDSCSKLMDYIWSEEMEYFLRPAQKDNPTSELYQFKGLSLLTVGQPPWLDKNLEVDYYKYENDHKLCSRNNLTTRLVQQHVALSGPRMKRTLQTILDIITDNDDEVRGPSDALKGALLRMIRQQILFGLKDCPFDARFETGINYESIKFVDKLDLDYTANYLTPVDKMNDPHRSQAERDSWARLCTWNKPETDHDFHVVSLQSRLLDLTQYREFRERCKSGKFSASISNTNRAIEIMILRSINYCPHKQDDSTPELEELETLCQFLKDLPDCDARSAAIISAGKSLMHCIRHYTFITGDIRQEGRFLKSKELAEILDELADSHHSNTIRQACCLSIALILLDSRTSHHMFIEPMEGFSPIYMSIMSVLFKLIQDEDPEIRDSGLKLLDQLADLTNERDEQWPEVRDKPSKRASSFERVAMLICQGSLDCRHEPQALLCFELLMKVLFNQSKNHSSLISLDKEGLFDKTKLNTFADHVQSAVRMLIVLGRCFRKRRVKIELNKLSFSHDIILEFEADYNFEGKDLGDYGWRHASLPGSESLLKRTPQNNNTQLVDHFIERVHSSLDYFAKGYQNMLTDTNYTYHELSLYKRIAFLRFVIESTSHELTNLELFEGLRLKLEEISCRSCETTLLRKTNDLLK